MSCPLIQIYQGGEACNDGSMDLLNVNKTIDIYLLLYILAADGLYFGCCGCCLCAVLERRHYYLDLCRQQSRGTLRNRPLDR